MQESGETKWYQYRRSEGVRLAGPWLLAWVVSDALLILLPATFPVRAVIALLPLPAFGWFLWRYARYVRSMDELRQRIELEALALAFPLTVALLMVLGQVQRARAGAGGVPITSEFWLYLAGFYLLGRGLAERRYR